MDTLELFTRLAVALAIGLLIGLERGWKAREEAEGERAAGLRTHALSSLLGGIWGSMAGSRGEAGIIALALGFAAYAATMTLFFYRETEQEGTRDATNLVAAMLAFALGAFAVVGNMEVAAAAGVGATALLALKPGLHAFVKRLTWEELRSFLVLLAMSVILLPALPNRTIDPWGTVNPFEIWLMTVLIALISFAGYVTIKLLGNRKGIAFTSVVGGLVSSTAVTVNMANLAREHPEQVSSLAGGALLSSAVMLARVVAVVAILNAALVVKLGPALALAGGVLAVWGFILLRQQGGSAADQSGTMTLGNPLDIAAVLKFGALLTAIIVLSKAAAAVAGNAGAYVIAALSGLADVDAVTLSMARMGGNGLSLEAAAVAIGIVVTVNSVTKAVLGWVGGGPAFGGHMARATGVSLLGGVIGLWLA